MRTFDSGQPAIGEPESALMCVRIQHTVRNPYTLNLSDKPYLPRQPWLTDTS